MAAEGYDVRLIMDDASGNDSTIVQHCAIADLTYYGVKVQGWIAIACELNADWANKPMAEGLKKIFNAHNPPWDALSTIQAAYANEKK